MHYAESALQQLPNANGKITFTYYSNSNPERDVGRENLRTCVQKKLIPVCNELVFVFSFRYIKKDVCSN